MSDPRKNEAQPGDSVEQNADGSGTTRRDFLKTAGTAALTGAFALSGASRLLAATGPALEGVGKARPSEMRGDKIKPRVPMATGRVIGANDRILVAIVGVGGQGGAHLSVTNGQRREANAYPIAVSDVYMPRLDRAKKAILDAEPSASAMAVKDYRDILDNKDIDAVIVATPEHWHAQIAVDAMEAGKHVYCEKPMTRYLDEAFAIADTQARTKRVFQIGSQYCSEAKWHVAGDAVLAGKIGQIVSSQGSYTRNSQGGEWNYGIDPGAGPDNLDWKMWLGSAPDRPWNDDSKARFFRYRKYRDYSCGLLGDLMPHKLHPLMIAVFGDKPEYPSKVTCIGTRNVSLDREVSDTCHTTVEFPSGHTMYILLSTVNEQGVEDCIRGHKATMRFGGDHVKISPERAFAEEMDEADLPVTGPGPDIGAHHQDWFEAIRTGRKPKGDIGLAIRVQTIVAMAELSELQSKTVRFDSDKRRIIV